VSISYIYGAKVVIKEELLNLIFQEPNLLDAFTVY
ncbi:MAG: hypothetical protein RLZ62_2600, partial [Bacteroidota bacterium]